MTDMIDDFTSTGVKLFAHQEAMEKLRNGQGQPISCHVMLTDVCQHTCAFCSVQARAGDTLPFSAVEGYLDILLRYGLKAVIFSGGGNPILYKDKESGKDFNDAVHAAYTRGLDIGLITNGMPLQTWDWDGSGQLKPLAKDRKLRKSWKTVRPDTLDKLTWVRISMSGLDHEENCVYVPDYDPAKTTMGFSYVAHDIYDEPQDPHHGKVSRPLDLISRSRGIVPDRAFDDRVNTLVRQISDYAKEYRPRYIRLLPNCLQPELIEQRCQQLDLVVRKINFATDRNVAFVQYKPPKAPHACYLGYVHPVLNCDGYVYPCDSCVLNEEAGHSFDNPWRICHWSEVAKMYDEPVRSLIKDPKKLCPGCVFSTSNNLLTAVVNGSATIAPPKEMPEHANFV